MYTAVNLAAAAGEEPRSGSSQSPVTDGGFTGAWQEEHEGRAERRNRTIEEPDVTFRATREPPRPPPLDDEERKLLPF